MLSGVLVLRNDLGLWDVYLDGKLWCINLDYLTAVAVAEVDL